MKNKKISEFLEGRHVVSIAADASVTEAARMLTDHDIGALPVLEGDTLVGIISEKDIVHRVDADHRDGAKVTVSEAMTASPATTSPDDRLAAALAAMNEGHFRHMPVLDEGKLVGMVSLRDIPASTQALAEQFAERRKRASS